MRGGSRNNGSAIIPLFTVPVDRFSAPNGVLQQDEREYCGLGPACGRRPAAEGQVLQRGSWQRADPPLAAVGEKPDRRAAGAHPGDRERREGRVMATKYI
jgi:hypothetical protein